jgi:rubredoxin
MTGSPKGVEMLDETREAAPEAGDYVEFIAAGATARGEFHCSKCGYGVTVHAALPCCPMCAGTRWEQAPWSPFTRARLQA